jgi:hypothetical protein
VGEWYAENADELKGWVDAVTSGLNSQTRSAVPVKVFDFSLRRALKDALDNGANARQVFFASLRDAKGMSGFNVMTFLNNHDFRSSNPSYGDALVHNNAILGYAYLLTNNQLGVPTVFYPDYYGYPARNSAFGTDTYGFDYHPTGLSPMKAEIDQLIKVLQRYINNSPGVDYLNHYGGTGNGPSAPNNYIEGSHNRCLLYQLKAPGNTGKEVIVAINFGNSRLRVDHQIAIRNGIAPGTRFGDILGKSAFPYAQVDNQNRIYIDIPAKSYSIWVQDVAPLSASLAITPAGGAICAGQSATLTTIPTGGTAPYTYSFSPNVSQTAPGAVGTASESGSYSVTVTDALGLTTVATTTLLVNAIPAATLSASAQDVCPGQPVTLTASPADGASYTFAGPSGAAIVPSGHIATVDKPGAYTVTVTSEKGCSATSDPVSVTMEDKVAPVVKTKDIIVYLNAAGKASITPLQVNNGSFDNCAIPADGYALNKYDFDCVNTGENTVTLTVTDESGNSDSKTAIVTVVDDAKPIVLTQPITIYLNANGKASVTPEQVNNGSSDNCEIAALKLDKTDFICEDIGANTVTLTVTDTKGNSDSKTAVVTVADAIKPTIGTQNITVQLDALGAVSIAPADVNDGSSDNCAIASATLDKTSFTCSNVGVNTVTLTVEDVNGNAASATAKVTVEDKVAPVVKTKNITVELNAAGQASITSAHVDAGTEDACGINSLSLSKTDFDCSNAGENIVVLTATDKNGNTASEEAIVTVKDKTPPVVITKNILIQLNASGKASIAAKDIDNGSSDACEGLTYSVSQSSFDCSNVGANQLTLTVTDKNGNAASAQAIVTVEDKVKPTVATKNISVTLVNGAATLTPAMIDDNSSDACGIGSLTLNKSSFDCTNLGMNAVTLTVTDKNGNTDSKTATVTVVGAMPMPSITVSKDDNTFTGVSLNTIVLGYGAQKVKLTPSNAQLGTTFTWTPAAGLTIGQNAVAEFTPTAAGSFDFTVEAVNSFGCKATTTVRITVIDARCGNGNVLLCHKADKNLLHDKTSCISPSGVAAHLDHGCTLGNCPSTATLTVVQQRVMSRAFKVFAINVAPNPTTTKFRIAVEGTEDETAVLRVYDNKGRLVEVKRGVRINSVVEVGARYRSGMYTVEVTQGDQRRQLQLVKIAD